MDMEKFINEMNELRRKHNFCIQDDCDLWHLMNGFLFFKNEESASAFAHITGVRYKQDGSGLEGDFEGTIKLMTEAVEVEYSNEK